MSGTAITFDLNEIAGLAQHFDAALLSGSDRKRLLEELGSELEVQTQERFNTKTGPDGNRWADLTESTKKYYMRRFGTTDPGNGLLFRHSPGLADTIESQTTDRDVLTGETRSYAEWLQDGTKKMVARPSLGIGTDDVTELAGIINQYMERHFA